ncbi:hypothetical protein ACLKA7_007670 [Drosophila subpalustris]
MDAEDGRDLDPYSPVSNSNTEEMEELLRVEEEILNSPPKAEPASKAKWCCSEAPSTLPSQRSATRAGTGSGEAADAYC